MIHCGADVNAVDGRGFTSYRFAVRFGQMKFANCWKKWGQDRRCHGRGPGAVFLRAWSGERRVDFHADEAADVLCAAAGRNDLNAVKRLLDAGVIASLSAAKMRRRRFTGPPGAGNSKRRNCSSEKARA